MARSRRSSETFHPAIISTMIVASVLLFVLILLTVQDNLLELSARVPVLLAASAEAEPIGSPTLQPIVRDDFNEYVNGSVVGQGRWANYVNGQNFVVQNSVSFRGRKALYNNSFGDSVVTKAATPRADGRQIVYVRTENRAQWGPYVDGNAQFRVTKGSWAGGTDIFAAVTFKSDGNVAYYDVANRVYRNFATYSDNRWTRLEIEWRSSDTTARYRVGEGMWTNWETFAGAASFTDFDHVGFDFYLPGGSGGAYFDTLR